MTTSTEPNVAINPSPSVTAANKLFVFLPGTGSVPTVYKDILISGAAKGYHTLGLNYPNPTAVGVLCGGSVDPNCFWDVRREIITGTPTSPLVSVGTSDAIVTRLTKAIGYLDATYPAEGWGQFLANGVPDWSKITMGGHSQGGGHVGVMAKLYALHRACYFDSPADWNTVLNAPATWTGYANVTPAAQQFGFTHIADTLVPYNQLSVIWHQMGLDAFGAAVSGDSTASPYGGSHMLTTNVTPPSGTGPTSVHSATVADEATPLSNGTPVFDPQWAYLCFQ